MPRSPFRTMRRLALQLAAVTLAGTAADAAAQLPPAVYSVGAAFDEARNRLVVFGGYDGTYHGDTWEWDGRAWSRMAVPGPSGRNAPQLVYDSRRHRIVLFGGDTRTDGALGDTWEYDGVAWRQLPIPGPPGRSTAQMIYDSRRGCVVLFGGAATGGRMLGDTWEFDGVRWTQRADSGPTARTLHGMAYDAARGRTVLFGGTAVLAPDAPSLGDTWEWDGNRWSRLEVQGPSARDHVAMAFDPVSGKSILHGGGNGAASAETWAFDGRAWTRISTAGPLRRFAMLSADTRGKRLLLYGGFDRSPSNELWALTGATWTRLAP